MNKDLIEQIITEAKINNKYEKDVVNKYNLSPNLFSYYKRKYGLSCPKGKHLNSKNRRKHHINDDFFSEVNELNSYWAGFIAADGNISKNNKCLTITLSIKDESILSRFLRDTKSDYKIMYGKSKGFDICSVKITSEKICSDLLKNFNITPSKSLTYTPPILDNRLKDVFIMGYIDGDGSIGLYNRQKGERLQISILGTLSMCSWVRERCNEIIKNNTSVRFKKGSNIFEISYASKIARTLFKHFYDIPIERLNRKWEKRVYDHCLNFKKYENLEMYLEVLDLEMRGKTPKEISNILEISQPMVYYFRKRNSYKELKSKILDYGN